MTALDAFHILTAFLSGLWIGEQLIPRSWRSRATDPITKFFDRLAK